MPKFYFPILLFILSIQSIITDAQSNVSCNTYLNIPNSQSYATIGDLNVSGNKITVEGIFSRDSTFTPEGYTSLNLVSKHWTPADVNYLLRADRAEITTSNGYFTTGGICSTFNKKTYHVAMVYDGIKLKFYRNGYLMSQVNCTGNMVQNLWPTTIGATAGSPTTNTTLIGLLNEVRIWNVARTQDEIKQYMNVTLPNPTLQTGLLAYYSFNNLLNKQGNSTYNANLFSGSSINVINPNCLLQIDSCVTALPITITSFSTKINNKKNIQLNWQTEEESGISKYIIQRSISTQGGFVSIGSVLANSNRSNNYTFIDDNTKSNIRYYYRLLILESTGESKYSIVRNEKIIEKGFYATVFPNPTTDKLILQVNNYTGILNIKVLNSIGQTILINKPEVTNSSALINLPFSDQPKGSYWIYLQTDNDVIIKKVIKL
jgi:hypothetical protein